MYTKVHWHKTGKLYQQFTLDMFATQLWFEKQRQAKQRLVNRHSVVADVCDGEDFGQPLPAVDVGKPY